MTSVPGTPDLAPLAGVRDEVRDTPAYPFTPIDAPFKLITDCP